MSCINDTKHTRYTPGLISSQCAGRRPGQSFPPVRSGSRRSGPRSYSERRIQCVHCCLHVLWTVDCAMDPTRWGLRTPILKGVMPGLCYAIPMHTYLILVICINDSLASLRKRCCDLLENRLKINIAKRSIHACCNTRLTVTYGARTV